MKLYYLNNYFLNPIPEFGTIVKKKKNATTRVVNTVTNIYVRTHVRTFHTIMYELHNHQLI